MVEPTANIRETLLFKRQHFQDHAFPLKGALRFERPHPQKGYGVLIMKLHSISEAFQFVYYGHKYLTQDPYYAKSQTSQINMLVFQRLVKHNKT